MSEAIDGAPAPKPVRRRLAFVADPGHGWLEVANEDIKALGIAGKITAYSFMTPSKSFLEEDLDAGTFLEAAKAAGWSVETMTRLVDGEAPLRNYASFKPEWIESEFMVGSQGRLASGEKARIEACWSGKVAIRGEQGGLYGCPSTRILSCFFTEERWQRMEAEKALSAQARPPRRSEAELSR